MADASITYGPNITQVGQDTFNIEVEEYNIDSLFKADIAQSRFFTVTIDKLEFSSGNPIKFKFPTPSEKDYLPKPPRQSEINVYEDFFPVKDVSFNFTSYNNISIPFNAFGNFPILCRKQLPQITINSYDFGDDVVERAVRKWEEECFPNSKYVAYLSEVTSKFEYISYDTTGRISYIRNLYVIPMGNVSVNRSYESNGEKIVSFSVIAVGEPGASSSGSRP